MGGNGYGAPGYAAPGALGPTGYDPKPASFTAPPIGSGASFKAQSVDNRSINQNSIGPAGSIRGTNSGVGDAPAAAALSSPMMGPGAAGVGAGGGPGNLPNLSSGALAASGAPASPAGSPAPGDTSAKMEYTYQAKAMYPCE